MLLSKALKEKEMDVRLRDKLLSEGSLEKSVVDTYLSDLTDDEANMIYTDAPVEAVSEEPSTEL